MNVLYCPVKISDLFNHYFMQLSWILFQDASSHPCFSAKQNTLSHVKIQHVLCAVGSTNSIRVTDSHILVSADLNASNLCMKLVSHVHNRPTINVFCAVNSNSVTNLYSSLQRSCQHTLYTVLSAGNTGCSDSWACKQCYSCLRATQPGSLHMVHRTHLVKPPDVGSHNVHSTWSRETSVHQSVGDQLHDICVF